MHCAGINIRERMNEEYISHKYILYVRNSIYSRNMYYNILYTVSGVYYDKVTRRRIHERTFVQFRFVEVSGHNLKSSQSRRFPYIQCLHY